NTNPSVTVTRQDIDTILSTRRFGPAAADPLPAGERAREGSRSDQYPSEMKREVRLIGARPFGSRSRVGDDGLHLGPREPLYRREERDGDIPRSLHGESGSLDDDGGQDPHRQEPKADTELTGVREAGCLGYPGEVV